MKSSSSKILKLGGIIVLGIFGLAGLIYISSNKNVSEKKKTEDDNTQKSDCDPETTKETNQDEIIKPASVKPKPKPEFSNPEDLVEHAIREVLRKNEFRSTDEFLENVIQTSIMLSEDISWFDYFPKSFEDLWTLLKRYSLDKEFEAKLYNKFIDKK